LTGSELAAVAEDLEPYCTKLSVSSKAASHVPIDETVDGFTNKAEGTPGMLEDEHPENP
jgi:hypothetical protein